MRDIEAKELSDSNRCRIAVVTSEDTVDRILLVVKNVRDRKFWILLFWELKRNERNFIVR